MNSIRAFFTGLLVGFGFAIVGFWFYPIYLRQFPHTFEGVVSAFQAIEWIGVLFFSVLSAIVFALREFRVVRQIDDALSSLGFLRDIWNLLTFWRR